MCKFQKPNSFDYLHNFASSKSLRRAILTGENEINFECSKIAPQNIMYDRRVVRGNTFAALVIPVSMPIFHCNNYERYAARPSDARKAKAGAAH